MTDGDDHGPRLRSAEFRFYEELNDFLPENRRKVSFIHVFHGTPSVKDTIQAIGVPHGAVDLILVDGQSVDFSCRLRGGERVAVYPVFERLDISPAIRLRAAPLRRSRFILDVHLGKLASYLRMLGFDSTYSRNWDDQEIIARSLKEGRIILSRDVGLLKHNRVSHGYWVRHDLPLEQLEEVIRSLELSSQFEPFTRCMECNGAIHAVSREAIRDQIDPQILERFDAFWQCADCHRIYWRGSHYERMKERIECLSRS